MYAIRSYYAQKLNVGVELLADIHFTFCQSNRTGGVVLEDRMRQVLRYRQLAPHRLILAPVVVITDEDHFLIIREEFMVWTGPNNVLRRIRQESYNFV